ncbi:hypothetical protein U9M48_002940 [Paspalum notatum var. saurae]|uniref:Uncharacterized protein n=1 Tax=Paspalum notatum var. saurae TaxID=547442 RepID=A0AAQ3PGQ6_PASNO
MVAASGPPGTYSERCSKLYVGAGNGGCRGGARQTRRRVRSFKMEAKDIAAGRREGGRRAAASSFSALCSERSSSALLLHLSSSMAEARLEHLPLLTCLIGSHIKLHSILHMEIEAHNVFVILDRQILRSCTVIWKVVPLLDLGPE